MEIFISNSLEHSPPLEEQKAIAEVLSSLDDKIDLLHRQNKTLEALAQTLFRQWFVEEAGDEWEVGRLGDIIDFNPPHSLKKGKLYPFLEMGNVQTNQSSILDWYDRAFTSGTKFKNGDTLLARITPSLENGKTAYVDFLKEGEIGWGSTEFIVMRMKEGYHPFISYVIARDDDFREFAIGNMTGSTGRQRAQAQDLKEYEISIPPKNVIEKLNSAIEYIPIKIKANSIEELAEGTDINIRDKNIHVKIIRDPQTNIDFGDKEHKRGPVALNDIIGFKIIDEGIGFNNDNLQSFETLDSEHKIDKGCRGVGRLLWLKVFKSVEIVSYFKQGKDVIKRVFTFDAKTGVSEPSDEKVDLSSDDIKTTIHLNVTRGAKIGSVKSC